MEAKRLEFKECDTCIAKPGSPTLCHGCLHNRDVIGRLNKFVSYHPVPWSDKGRLKELYQCTHFEYDHEWQFVSKSDTSMGTQLFFACVCGKIKLTNAKYA